MNGKMNVQHAEKKSPPTKQACAVTAVTDGYTQNARESARKHTRDFNEQTMSGSAKPAKSLKDNQQNSIFSMEGYPTYESAHSTAEG